MISKWRTATGAISALSLLFAAITAYGQPSGGPGFTSFIQMIDTPSSYDGANNQCLLVDEDNRQIIFDSCSGTPGDTIILDLGDDGANESTAIEEIAIINAPTGLVTEPSADKLKFDFSVAVPKATALALDPADCSTGSFARGISADGTASCASAGVIQVTGDDNDIFSETDDTFTIDVSAPWPLADALAADGANCSAGQYPLGVDAAGIVQSCTADDDVPEAADFSNLTSGSGIGQAVAGTLTVDIVTPGSDGDTSTTESPSGMQFVSGDLTLLRGCADENVLKWDETLDRWECAADAAGASGSSIILDLADDSNNESTALGEIAVTGDTHNILTESSNDKLLINLANPVPKATALNANGANCSAGQYPLGVDASGAVESCTADDDVPDSGDFGNLVGGAGVTRSTATLSLDLLTVETDAASATQATFSGLEFVGTGDDSELTLMQGCDDNQVLRWDEASDYWHCSDSETLLTTGTDGDSSTTSSDSGLELVGGESTMLRGCDDDDVLKWDEDADEWLCAPDGGGSTPTLDESFDAGTGVIDGAIFGTKTLKLGSATGYFEIGDDPVNGPTITCVDDGGGCHHIIDIPAGKDLKIYGNGTLLETLTAAGVHTYSNAGRLKDDRNWNGLEMTGDGAECDTDPTAETVNGVPGKFGVRCPMTGTEADGRIYDIGKRLPDNFDNTANITFRAKAYLVNDEGAGTVYHLMNIDCVGEDEVVGTWGTTATMDFTIATGDTAGDEIWADAVATFDPSAAGCDPGDTIYWRLWLCDTDATPTSSCTSSAGREDNLSYAVMNMEFTVNSRTK